MWDRAIILRVVGASLWGLCLLPPARANVLDVSIGTVTGSPGSSVSVPVDLAIESENFVSSFTLNITYETGMLDFVDATQGIAVPEEWVFVANTVIAGTVSILGAATDNVVIETGGKLLYLNFRIVSDAPLGLTPLDFNLSDTLDPPTSFYRDYPEDMHTDVSFLNGGVSVVPEPSSLLLMGVMVACGLPFLPLRRRRVTKAD